MEVNASGNAREETVEVANALHSAAIHLLRRVARRDVESGLSAARLSALSVIVFSDGITLGELARAEGVSMPTMSRLVAALESDGLLTRSHDWPDKRVVSIRATELGRDLLQRARLRRVHDLAGALEALPPEEQRTLREAARILDGLFLEAPHSEEGDERHE